jgi:hypothetical protein
MHLGWTFLASQASNTARRSFARMTSRTSKTCCGLRWSTSSSKMHHGPTPKSLAYADRFGQPSSELHALKPRLRFASRGPWGAAVGSLKPLRPTNHTLLHKRNSTASLKHTRVLTTSPKAAITPPTLPISERGAVTNVNREFFD